MSSLVVWTRILNGRIKDTLSGIVESSTGWLESFSKHTEENMVEKYRGRLKELTIGPVLSQNQRSEKLETIRCERLELCGTYSDLLAPKTSSINDQLRIK